MIVDTVAVSDFLDGDPDLGAILKSASRMCLPAVVLGEYWFGLLNSTHRARLEPLLATWLESAEVLAIDRETAGRYAVIRQQLKTAGTPIPWHDIWISALALQHDLPVVSRDKHFEWVAGVKRIGW